MFRLVVGVIGDGELIGLIELFEDGEKTLRFCSFDRERFCQNTGVGDTARQIPFRGVVFGVNVNALTLLRVTVLCRVDNAPFDAVTERVEAGEHNGEVAASLLSGRLQQAVNVLQNNIFGGLKFERTVNIPPEHALLTFNAVRLREGLGNRVILAGETAAEQVSVGNFVETRLHIIKYGVDVAVFKVCFFAETFLVATCRELAANRSRGLPLVRPNSREGTRGGQGHAVGVIAFKS